ncbi:hypothetical protein CANCADRAFT_1389 [Tortispora caseinolytica NRRL Y-17796]|uniref:Uncharacterized protein n=1 Tax=Tortispora caseinolytica NRRL Y-17796 TaxID=767744 RepID=A0A1E4TM11_9ASCO|nr:hypothetical protein CANCADRAFT_1389 [Tortispora caseinolytica NRRL Y-17796]
MTEDISRTETPLEMPSIVGISFGNKTSSVAVVSRDGSIELIANQDGDRFIPSALSYLNDDEYHGSQALSQLVRNANNTVVNFRDFIGKEYAKIDPTHSARSAHPVESDSKVSYQINGETVSVDTISARHLTRIRDLAADYLGVPVTKAVVAVPSDFTDVQIQALHEIAKTIGLDILQTIKEPVAALIPYTFQSVHPSDKISLVLDIGASRTDGAVIAVRGGLMCILATAHSYDFGGSSLDDILVDFIAKEFEKKYKVDPKSEPRAVAKMYAEAENVKRALSASKTATISIESLASGYDFHMSINRLKFELLARKVFELFTSFADEVVAKSGLDSLQISEIVLAGGTSNIPKISTLLSAKFGELTTVVSPSTSIKAFNTSELIARGCAMQASWISALDADDIQEIMQPSVTVAAHTSKAIGVQLPDNELVVVVEQTTAVPIRKTVVLPGPADDGSVLVSIAEADTEIVSRKIEKPAPSENDDDDDDLDGFEDDEDEEIREIKVKSAASIADIVLEDVKGGSKIEIVINITSKLGMSIAARPVGSSSAVRLETECSLSQ